MGVARTARRGCRDGDRRREGPARRQERGARSSPGKVCRRGRGMKPAARPYEYGDARRALGEARGTPQPGGVHDRHFIEAFRERAWARAYLWAAGDLDLHEAVNLLQHDAEASGLVARAGQDAVQRIVADASRPFRERTDG